MLVGDIMRKPAVTRLAEQALNPMIGKSWWCTPLSPGAVGGGMALGEQGGCGGIFPPR